MTENKLGRYELKSILGQGAMGVVYKAYDPQIGRTVAIKTIRLDLADSSFEENELRERFFNEARSAGTMSHPNIVTIYDVGSEGKIAYITMEYIEGSDLKQYMASKGKLPFKEIYRIIHSVASGLDYSGSKGIVHRDIKPANILITNDGMIKITDFGIAKLPSSTVTQSGMLMGTPAYVSPEQVMGKKLDVRSDLYSLGVIFYELVTGRRPFEGDPTTVIFQVVQAKPPDPVIQLENIPPGLKKIILKAISKNVEDRYQSGEEFIKGIKSIKGISQDNLDITKKIIFVPLPKRKEKPISHDHIKKLKGDTDQAVIKEKAVDDLAKTVVISDQSTQIRKKRKRRALVLYGLLFLIIASGALGYFYRDKLIGLYNKFLKKSEIETTDKSSAKQSPIITDSSIGSDNKTTAAGNITIPSLPKYSSFLLTSNPEGASINIDGEDSGSVTPMEYQISESTPDAINFILTKECYQPFQLEIKKAEIPSEEIAVSLLPMERSIVIETTPEEAEINIEGSEEILKSPTTVNVNCLQPLKINVTKDGYLSREVILSYSEVLDNFKVELAPKIVDGYLNIVTTYPITIYHNKAKLGTIKKSGKFKMAAGKQKISVFAKKPVFINTIFDQDISVDQTTRLVMPKTGKINVSAVPGNARIYIDGIDIDDAPLTDFMIAAGRYNITYKWPDGKTYREKITVKADQTDSFMAKKPD